MLVKNTSPYPPLKPFAHTKMTITVKLWLELWRESKWLRLLQQQSLCKGKGAKLQEQTTPDSHLCESNLCVRSFLLFKPPKHAIELHKEGTCILQSELNDFLLVLCVHAIFLPPRVILGVCKYLWCPTIFAWICKSIAFSPRSLIMHLEVSHIQYFKTIISHHHSFKSSENCNPIFLFP